MAMTEKPPPTSEPAEDELPEQMRVRREKRDRILAEGIDPYPVEVPRTHSLARSARPTPICPPTPPPATSSASPAG